jgi:hypothetical protein
MSAKKSLDTKPQVKEFVNLGFEPLAGDVTGARCQPTKNDIEPNESRLSPASFKVRLLNL